MVQSLNSGELTQKFMIQSRNKYKSMGYDTALPCLASILTPFAETLSIPLIIICDRVTFSRFAEYHEVTKFKATAKYRDDRHTFEGSASNLFTSPFREVMFTEQFNWDDWFYVRFIQPRVLFTSDRWPELQRIVTCWNILQKIGVESDSYQSNHCVVIATWQFLAN